MQAAGNTRGRVGRLGGLAAGGSRWPSTGWSVLVCLAILASARLVEASCNRIPGVATVFRAARGTVDRPFASPGEVVEFRLSPSCDQASPGFASTAEAHTVTLLF